MALRYLRHRDAARIAHRVDFSLRGQDMETSRRTLLAGAAAMLLPQARSAAAASTPPVDRLRAYLLETVGRPTSERVAAAHRALTALTPLAEPTLLVEIAAIGTLVRTGSTRDALREGYPRRSRTAIEAAQRRLPDLAWSKALDGAWHFEVERRSTIGAALYGASRARGEALFADAARLDPADGGVRLAHVVALLGDPAAAEAARARGILRALPGGDGSPYHQLVATQAAQLARLLDEGRVRAATDRALALF